MGSLGRQGATLTVQRAINELRPKAVLLLGIAFGVNRKKQRLGDVLIAESIFPYELQRVEDGYSINRGTEMQCGWILSERFRTRRSDWQLARGNGLVVAQQGQVLSGEKLIDSLEFRNRLIERFPTAIGGEMEGAGAYAAVIPPMEMILIKGICDWADGHKNDRAQPFAAYSAVSLAKHVLGKADVLGPLGARDRTGRSRDTQGILEADDKITQNP